MDIEVLEGQLVEVPAAGITGMDRRADGDDDTAKIGHLHHVIDEDPTLIDVLDLEPGHSASRSHPDGPWTRHVGYPD